MKKIAFISIAIVFISYLACVEKSGCRTSNQTNKRKNLNLAPGFK